MVRLDELDEVLERYLGPSPYQYILDQRNLEAYLAVVGDAELVEVLQEELPQGQRFSGRTS